MNHQRAPEFRSGCTIFNVEDNFQLENGIFNSREVYNAKKFVTSIALLAAISAILNSEKIFALLDNKSTVLALQSE